MTLSTAEAEYVALLKVKKEVVWMRHLLENLEVTQDLPTKVLSDNQSAIRLAKNPEQHNRTKHIDIRHHYVREKVHKKVIELNCVPSDQQIADIVTNSLLKPAFERLRSKTGLTTTEQRRSQGGCSSTRPCQIRLQSGSPTTGPMTASSCELSTGPYIQSLYTVCMFMVVY